MSKRHWVGPLGCSFLCVSPLPASFRRALGSQLTFKIGQDVLTHLCYLCLLASMHRKGPYPLDSSGQNPLLENSLLTLCDGSSLALAGGGIPTYIPKGAVRGLRNDECVGEAESRIDSCPNKCCFLSQACWGISVIPALRTRGRGSPSSRPA